jgi:DNA-binding GntR family transcriptional regulator
VSARPSPSLNSADGVRRPAQRSIVEQVIDSVRRSILDGSLPPGAPVNIAELSVRLDVSHIPVREALRRLEGEGLVELRRGRSAVVTLVSREDMLSVFRLRTLLEADAMARAARRYSDADIVGLEAAFEALTVRAGDDAETLSARHTDFHERLVAPAASNWDQRLLDLLWQAHARYMYLLLPESPGGSETRLRDLHLALLDAARARSPQAARRAVRDHQQDGLDLLAPLLGGA